MSIKIAAVFAAAIFIPFLYLNLRVDLLFDYFKILIFGGDNNFYPP